MGTDLECRYKKSDKIKFIILFLSLTVFLSILFCSSVASAAVDVTLTWDSSAGADGYKLFYREDGQSYNYTVPAWEGGATTGTIYGLDESTTYHFVVRAYNGEGESVNSNEAHLYPGGPNQAPTSSFTASPTSGDAPLTVIFNGSGSSDEDGTVVSYEWNFGDGSTDSGASASHTYNSAGNYTAILTVTDDDGATDTFTRQIQVTTAPIPNQAPNASFTASPTSGYAPLSVSFNGSGSTDPDGTIVSYSWNYGDGATGNGVSRSHTYNSAGNYTATLTVTDDDGATDTFTRQIQVTETPASNLPPNQPVISSPYDGEMNTDLLLTVETEPFSDPDGDTHKETQWQIVKAADSSVVLEIVSSKHLTKVSVPHTVLDRNTTYNVSVQFVDSHSEPSLWSDPVEFTTHNGVDDFDGDGIPDDSEVDDTVDLNGDGTPDNDQPNVIKSILSAVGDNQPFGVSKISPAITAIEVLQPINPSTILDKTNKPETFLFGLASYRLRVSQPGASVLVRVYYSENVSGVTRYYLYDTINGWQDYTQYTTFNPDGKSVTVELKDGGYGDSDGVANGIIVDPGGIVGAGTSGLDSGSGGGCFIAAAAAHDSSGQSNLQLSAASSTEKHDWFDPTISVLLMPLVGIRYVLDRTALATMTLIGFILILSILSWYTIIYRERHSR